jgi:predicted O-methyltransferase YrrM
MGEISLERQAEVGWRSRALFAVLGLRSPIAQHTTAEAELLRRYAAGAGSIVELGVAEGRSAKLFGDAVKPGGTVYLIDPYPPGRIFGMNMRQIVAKRVAKTRDGARMCWIRSYSSEAAQRWKVPIDFLFIDADHRYVEVKRDWEDWNGFVVPGGCVALHDARVFAGGWTTPEYGPVRLVRSIQESPDWEGVDCADSTVVFRKAGAGSHLGDSRLGIACTL